MLIISVFGVAAALAFNLISDTRIHRVSTGLLTSVLQGQNQLHSVPPLDQFPLPGLFQATSRKDLFGSASASSLC